MKKVKKVSNAIAEVFDIDAKFFMPDKRRNKFMYPKKTLCYILHRFEGMTMVEISNIMGYADHTTVCYHIQDLKDKCSVYEELRSKVTKVIMQTNEIYKGNISIT